MGQTHSIAAGKRLGSAPLGARSLPWSAQADSVDEVDRGMRARLGTIRVRVVLGFAVAFLGMTVFGALSYRYFLDIESEMVFLSRADGLLNTALEVRRYEKNYLLYHHEKDYAQALTYLGQMNGLLGLQGDRIRESLGRPALGRMSEKAKSYGQDLHELHTLVLAGRAADAPEFSRLVDGLRGAGQQLIADAEALAAAERGRIQGRLQGYLPLLITFLVCLGGIGSLLVYVLTVKLVRPLRSIEAATREVAQGEFRPLPGEARPDEVGSLVRAFNRMVVQLRHNREQLIQTEKLSALGTLTSGVAHELNNPLNNISTSCQILQEEMAEGADDYHLELLTAIDEQVGKARDIVGSLLEFSRQREFELNPEDLKAVVDDALKLIKGEIPPSVAVAVDVPRGITAQVDKAHLVQALLNLFMNGIQAMEGGGRLSVTGRSSAQAGEAVLEISDTGEGMAPEILPRIFDPFFTTKDVGRGTGLGLSIVYGVVERHRGGIEVDSAPGRGTRFTLHLPLTAREVA